MSWGSSPSVEKPESLQRLAACIQTIRDEQENPTDIAWDCDMTWIVARKAILAVSTDSWSSLRADS